MLNHVIFFTQGNGYNNFHTNIFRYVDRDICQNQILSLLLSENNDLLLSKQVIFDDRIITLLSDKTSAAFIYAIFLLCLKYVALSYHIVGLHRKIS